MKKQAKFKIKPKVISKKVDDQFFILDIKNGKLLTLNETASFIWEKLKKTRTVDEIASLLIKEFSIDAQTAKKDTQDFIKKYVKKGLIAKKRLGSSI